MFNRFLNECKNHRLQVYEKHMTLEMCIERLNKLYDLNSTFIAKYNQWLQLQNIYDFDPNDTISSLEHQIRNIEFETYLIISVHNTCILNNPSHRSDNESLLTFVEFKKNNLKTELASNNRLLSTLLPNQYIYRDNDPYTTVSNNSSENVRTLTKTIEDLSNQLKNINLNESTNNNFLRENSFNTENGNNIIFNNTNTNINIYENNMEKYISFLKQRLNNAEIIHNYWIFSAKMCQFCYHSIEKNKNSILQIFLPDINSRNLQRSIIYTQIEELLTTLIDIINNQNHNSKKRPHIYSD